MREKLNSKKHFSIEHLYYDCIKQMPKGTCFTDSLHLRYTSLRESNGYALRPRTERYVKSQIGQLYLEKLATYIPNELFWLNQSYLLLKIA